MLFTEFVLSICFMKDSTTFFFLSHCLVSMFWPITSKQNLRGCRVRTDKANFGPSPIGLIFSVKVNHYIQCTNIAFIPINALFSFFSRRFSKCPRNWLICLGRLWNFAMNVERCQNTVFYSNRLNALQEQIHLSSIF